MNKEEYELTKRKIQEEGKVTKEIVENAPTPTSMSEEDIKKIVTISNAIMTEEEKERIIEEDNKKEQEKIYASFGGESLSNVPELADFLLSEEHLTLGTNARIPVPIEVMGHPVKVYIRPLSRKELIECRQRAKAKGHADIDYEAILMVCSKFDGTPYTEKELNQLGYGHMQTISEAIMIASGESLENTKSALREHLLDEFLNKFTTQA